MGWISATPPVSQAQDASLEGACSLAAGLVIRRFSGPLYERLSRTKAKGPIAAPVQVDGECHCRGPCWAKIPSSLLSPTPGPTCSSVTSTVGSAGRPKPRPYKLHQTTPACLFWLRPCSRLRPTKRRLPGASAGNTYALYTCIPSGSSFHPRPSTPCRHIRRAKRVRLPH